MGEITDLIFALLGKLGRWYNVKAKRVCFIIWSFVMLYWIARNFQLGLKVQTLGCFFSLAMHIYGFFTWKKKGIK